MKFLTFLVKKVINALMFLTNYLLVSGIDLSTFSLF